MARVDAPNGHLTQSPWILLTLPKFLNAGSGARGKVSPHDRPFLEATAIAARQGFYWGDAVDKSYFARAEAGMDLHWMAIVQPVLTKYLIDYGHVLDLAAGHGRNSARLARLAKKITVVDINPENIRFCRSRFEGDSRFEFVCNDGASLSAVADNSITFFYTFDSMVHFDAEIVKSYLAEAYRTLISGGYGFFHYSNFDLARRRSVQRAVSWRKLRNRPLRSTRILLAACGYALMPGIMLKLEDFRNNPHWRAFMTRSRFEEMAQDVGFEVVQSSTIAWGGIADLDAISLLRKPA